MYRGYKNIWTSKQKTNFLKKSMVSQNLDNIRLGQVKEKKKSWQFERK